MRINKKCVRVRVTLISIGFKIDDLSVFAFSPRVDGILSFLATFGIVAVLSDTKRELQGLYFRVTEDIRRTVELNGNLLM